MTTCVNYIGVACVKNESDIIEAFVRHNLYFLDRLIVLDHGSTDNTPTILRSLQKEGLNIEVIRDDSIGKLQGEKMTVLMRQAAEAGAKWVVLLDGDEFIKSSVKKLPLPPENSLGVLKVAWINYCAQADDDPSETNPVRRIRHRLIYEPFEQGTLLERTLHIKSIVRQDIALHPQAQVMQGNHKIIVGGVEADHQFLDLFALAHFSLRSPGQYASKISIGTLQQLARSSMSAPIDSFYLNHLKLIQQDFDAFTQEFYQLVPTYLELTNHSLEKVCDPITYCGGTLRYTRKISDKARLISNLYSYSEILARTLSQRPAQEEEGKKIAVNLTLRENYLDSPSLCSIPVQLNAISPEIITLPLHNWNGQGELVLEIAGPIGFVECLSVCLRRSNSLQEEPISKELRKFMYISKNGHFIYHEHYFTFVKGGKPAELVLQPLKLGWQGPWKELELSLRFDVSPSIIGLRFFQEDTFDDKTVSLALVAKLEAKVSQLVRIRGFLQHQAEWIKSSLFK